jgi:hypothetical protein
LKIEQLIVQYLYLHKQVSLQGIGTIKLKPNVILPAEGDKDYVMPPDAFSFEYNLKTGEDEKLVDYIVEHTNKIKPLASSDLESYAILAKQFLNIGKPLVMEGVGSIQKSQQGIYEFFPGQFITPKIGDIPKLPREKKEEAVSFESETTASKSSKGLTIGLVIAGILLASMVAYYFLVVQQPSTEQVTETPVEVPAKKDTVQTVAAAVDSTKKDSLATAITPPVTKTDSTTFKIVLKEYTTEQAVQKAYNRLTSYGHKLVIFKADSAKFKLMLPFYKPLSDTTMVKDSVKEFFGGNPYVQL